MKKIIIALLLAFILLPARAQDVTIVPELQDDFSNIDTLPQPKKFKSRHMFGVKYSYDLCTVQANPNIGQSYITSPMNFEVAYTYYSALWDYVNIFGLQIGARYAKQGYASEYRGWGEKNTIIEFPFLAQVHIDGGPVRFLIDLGPYYGYKLDTDRETGFDQYDIRHDYGIMGGAGIGFVFLKNLELHLEGRYKYSLCSMYHTNKFSDLYWMLAYPRNIIISAGVFYNLW